MRGKKIWQVESGFVGKRGNKKLLRNFVRFHPSRFRSCHFLFRANLEESKPEAKPKEPESNGFDANGVEDDDDDDDAPLSPVITPNKVDYLLKRFTHLSYNAYSFLIRPLCRQGLLNEVLMILFDVGSYPSEPLKTNTTVVELFKCFFLNGQP